MKKFLMIVGGIVVAIVIIFVVVYFYVSATSEKLVCKSKEGDITLMYDDKTIKGYTSKGITYDLDGQKAIAERIGIEEYIKQFSNWFSTNTSGTCTKD